MKTKGKKKFGRAVTAEWMNVSPDLATVLLRTSVIRSAPTKRWVDELAGHMAACSWRETNDPIVFSPEGKLLDGRNRLLAVVQSGSTQRFLVVFNVSKGKVRDDKGRNYAVSRSLRS